MIFSCWKRNHFFHLRCLVANTGHHSLYQNCAYVRWSGLVLRHGALLPTGMKLVWVTEGVGRWSDAALESGHWSQQNYDLRTEDRVVAVDCDSPVSQRAPGREPRVSAPGIHQGATKARRSFQASFPLRLIWVYRALWGEAGQRTEKWGPL